MYRCIGCDAPAQGPCQEGCPSSGAFEQAMRASSDKDPYGWPHEDKKLDIQAGVKVPAPREGVIIQ